jgi:hypothetical protein
VSRANGHTAPPDLHPSLAPLHEAIVIASGILTDDRYRSTVPGAERHSAA